MEACGLREHGNLRGLKRVDSTVETVLVSAFSGFKLADVVGVVPTSSSSSMVESTIIMLHQSAIHTSNSKTH